ncbi:carboxylating nicotinate-nucleotide diphosphorylase [Pseudogracilibacillus sp. ICA-222130]|uniref:carboxylating nicotinate-nucleotide diphosphorylase n=1 Tax=Pseudogracilibacillus sp. ICA-222130 TaxID=3134655 RepID=UPI0030C4549D
MNDVLIKEKLKQFYLEDVGQHDITAMSIFSKKEPTNAYFYAKEAGIIAGVSIIKQMYHIIDPSIRVTLKKQDGQSIKEQETIAEVTGPTSSILVGERVILNLIQRMSGIATTTNKAIQKLNDPTIKICDTRKTTPGLRIFEKYAVACGGGWNHRNGLYDGAMIKDNHIVAAGSIKNAVQKVREQVGPMIKIEVETETKEQVIEAVDAKCDIIMFDNRTPSEIQQLLPLVPKHIYTEASGGITLDTINEFQHVGVDFISLGFLTHSVKALDISVMIEGGY